MNRRRNTLGPITSTTLNTRRSSVAHVGGFAGRRSTISKKENKVSRMSMGPSIKKVGSISKRSSVSGARHSMGGRKSSYMNSKPGIRREDPRNLKDTENKKEAIRQILTYLSNMMYGDILTPKALVREI